MDRAAHGLTVGLALPWLAMPTHRAMVVIPGHVWLPSLASMCQWIVRPLNEALNRPARHWGALAHPSDLDHVLHRCEEGSCSVEGSERAPHV